MMLSDDREKLAEIEKRWADTAVSLWPKEFYGKRQPISEKWSFAQFKPFGGSKFIVSENSDGEVRVVMEVHWGGNSQCEALANCREDVWWLLEKLKELENPDAETE